MNETELLPCPFCGGKAEIRRCKIYLDEAMQVRCMECGASQPKVLSNHLLYTDGKEMLFTEAMAQERIMNRWNRRAEQ